MPQTTIKQLLQQARERIDLLDAELIVAFVLKKTREFVIAHQDYEVRKFASAQVCKLFRKRADGIALAYLIGHKEFFGLDFVVNKSVLIPRHETEVLVEEALKKFAHLQTCKLVYYIDVGTGSGCIPIAIIKNLPTHTLTHLQTFATDISKPALRIAKLNAKKHGVKINFLHGNLLTRFLKTCKPANLQTCKLIITANLPYLTPKQYKNSPSIQREPKSALVAGKTGLELCEKLFKQLRQLSTSYAIRHTSFLEIDPSQSKAIKILIKKYFPNFKIEIKKDLSGRDRVVEIIFFG